MKAIQLGHDQIAVVDDQDYERLAQHTWHWRVVPSGLASGFAYRQDHATGQFILMHREILDAPDFATVIHRDDNGLNNTRVNLVLQRERAGRLLR